MEYSQADKLKFHPAEVHAISSATDTYTKGIDTMHYGALSWGISAGTIANGHFEIMAQESDDGTTWVELGDGLNGQPAGTPYVAVDRMIPHGGIQFAVADSNTAKGCGSVGKKRYHRLRITSVGVTTSASLTVMPVQGHPTDVPTM